MSSQHFTASSYTTFSNSSSSSSATNQSGNNSGGAPQTISHRFTEESYTDPRRGTTTHRTAQHNDEPAVRQTVNVPVGGGKPTITGYGGDHQNSSSRRIEDVSEQEARDREYEDRMEEEYAKRDGGA